MARQFVDRAYESCTPNGTTDASLLGAKTGYVNIPVGGSVCLIEGYVDDAPTGAWEVVEGTRSGSTFTRDRVIASSNSNNPVDFGTPADIAVVSDAEWHTLVDTLLADLRTDVDANTNAIDGKEDDLGVPAQNGYVLSSATDGTRTWVEMTGGGTGDMTKAVYDTNDSGVVDDAELVNGLTVETAVPPGAVFTDTIYDDTAIQAEVDANTGHRNTASLHLSTTEREAIDNSPNTPNGTNPFATQQDIADAGGGDMLKSVYDTNNSGVVDDAEKVNNLTVETAVPPGAVFTDTIYDDTAIRADVDANTAAILTKEDDLGVPAQNGYVLSSATDGTRTWVEMTGGGTGDMTKAVYDTNDSGVVDDAELVNGLTVETAVPPGAVFTDTIYDDSAIQSEVDANTAHRGDTNNPHNTTPALIGAVAKTGDTMSGELWLMYGSSPAIVLKPTSSGGSPQIRIKDSSGATRGYFYVADSDGSVSLRRDDASSNVLTIVTLSDDGNLDVSGSAPTAASHLTRKDYVDQHPGVATAWCMFQGADGALIGSYNVASVTVDATGLFTINFTTEMATTALSVVANASLSDSSTNDRIAMVYSIATTDVKVKVTNGAGGLRSDGIVSIQVFGGV